MIVAGFGFRQAATLASLHDALAQWGQQVDLVASVTPKAQAPVLGELAAELSVPIRSIDQGSLTQQAPQTQSEAAQRAFGTGSVAEASALAAAGPGARLLGPRKISTDGMATCALATGDPQ